MHRLKKFPKCISSLSVLHVIHVDKLSLSKLLHIYDQSSGTVCLGTFQPTSIEVSLALIRLAQQFMVIRFFPSFFLSSLEHSSNAFHR